MKELLSKTRIGPIHFLIFFLCALVFVSSLYFLLIGSGKKAASEISPDQIKLQKGDKTVIVNENGVVEYYSESGIYYDYWDESRTRSFFDYIRQKAREYLVSPPKDDGQGGYYVTLYLDGKEVKIWVSDDEIIEEVFLSDPTSDAGSGGSLNDYFNSYFNPSPTGISSFVSPTSQPSGPGVVSAGDGTTPIGGSGVAQSPVNCSLYSAKVTGRTIISNALCIDE